MFSKSTKFQSLQKYIDKVHKETYDSNIENKRKGDENMKDRKTYTAAELNSAERLMQILSTIPEDKRTIVVMMANSFVAGMEAREHMKKA